ncbi:hypothetical protein SRRS_52060 [Sporomusa rhizae]
MLSNSYLIMILVYSALGGVLRAFLFLIFVDAQCMVIGYAIINIGLFSTVIERI